MARRARFQPRTICARLPHGRYDIAFLSLQDDGSISIGLRDRTYIAPQLRARIGIWNAYNRIGIQYRIPSTPDALEPIQNPHFTFHPSIRFHLRADGEDPIFSAIADIKIAIMQQGIVPWLRLISAPLTTKLGSERPARADDIAFPILDLRCSVLIAVDFIDLNFVGYANEFSCREMVWQDVALRISCSFTYPQIPALWWFHSC